MARQLEHMLLVLFLLVALGSAHHSSDVYLPEDSVVECESVGARFARNRFSCEYHEECYTQCDKLTSAENPAANVICYTQMDELWKNAPLVDHASFYRQCVDFSNELIATSLPPPLPFDEMPRSSEEAEDVTPWCYRFGVYAYSYRKLN